MRARNIVALATVVAGAYACSLDLDETLIGKNTSIGLPSNDSGSVDGDVASEGGGPVDPTAAPCTKDEECASSNGCLTGRCDQTRKACVFDVCHATACGVGTCTQATRTCSSSTPYKLKAGELTLERSTQGGIVAAYPWLFQLTATGLIAYDVSNPTVARPPQVPVVGLGFIPTAATRSGNRIWLTALPVGTPARLPLAFIDVPADPFAARLEAHSILANYNRPAGEGFYFFPAADRGALTVQAVATFPNALFEASLTEPVTKTANPLPGTDTSIFPAGATGNRLIVEQLAPAGGGFTNQLGLVTGAGTASAQSQPLVPIADAAGLGALRSFTTTPSGGMFLLSNALQQNGLSTVTRAVRGYFLLRDGAATLDPQTKGFDIETYDMGSAPAANTQVFAAPAFLDDNTALVPVATGNKDEGAEKGFAAIALVKSDLTVARDKRISLGTTRIGQLSGISASKGFGYVSTNPTTADDPAGTAGSKILVIDPACTP